MEDDYIIATFLHPNYKQLRGATSSQIANCHATCRRFLFPDSPSAGIVEEDEDYEPPMKKSKPFMTLLMDKRNNRENSSLDEVDKYIEMQVKIMKYIRILSPSGSRSSSEWPFQILLVLHVVSSLFHVVAPQLNGSSVLQGRLSRNGAPISTHRQ